MLRYVFIILLEYEKQFFKSLMFFLLGSSAPRQKNICFYKDCKTISSTQHIQFYIKKNKVSVKLEAWPSS